MSDELKQQHSVDAELRKLIEDAAKLLGVEDYSIICRKNELYALLPGGKMFNPCDPERGDLMKVADAAGLGINFEKCSIRYTDDSSEIGVTYLHFKKGDPNSLALAVLRAASAVLKAKGEPKCNCCNGTHGDLGDMDCGTYGGY